MRSHRKAWLRRLLVAVLALADAGLAEQSTPSPQNRSVGERLANGLSIVTAVDRRVPLVAIDVSYLTGDADDPPEAPGLARLIGFLIEGGPTKHLDAGESDRIIAAAEVPFRRSVTVSTDATHISLVVPAHAVELALWLEAERMAFQPVETDARAVDLALRKVRSIGIDTSNHGFERMLMRAAFGPQHPYFIESPAINTVTPTAVLARFREFYSPASATISVVGDIDQETVKRHISRYFSAIRGVTTPDRPVLAPTPWNRNVHVRSPNDAVVVAVEWVTAGAADRTAPTWAVVAELLRERLEKRVVDSDRTAKNVTVNQNSLRLGGLFAIVAELTSKDSRDGFLSAVSSEVENIRSGRFDDDSLKTAKRRALVRQASAVKDLAAKAASMGTRHELGYAELDEDLRAYETLDAREISSAAEHGLRPETAVTVETDADGQAAMLGQADGEPRRQYRSRRTDSSANWKDDLVWYRPPALEVPRAFIPPALVESTVAGDVRVAVASRGDSPIVRIRFVAPWPAVSVSGLTPKIGSAVLSATWIDGATLSTHLRSIGTNWAFGASRDTVSLAVDAAPDAVSDVVRLVVAGFSSSGRGSGPRRGALETAPADKAPNVDIMTERLWAMVAESLQAKKVDRRESHRGHRVLLDEDFDRAARTLRSARPLSISFVGDIEPSKAIRLVEANFGESAAKPARTRRQALDEWGPARGVHLIDDERETSAGFLLACPVAQRGTAEFEAGIALSKMLSRSWRASGSPFASRPSSEIVESAGSAHLTVQFAAGSDDAAAAVTAVLKRLDGFRHPTASMDLDALRRERTFSLMSDCDSANAEANLVARLTALGLTGGTLGTEYDNAARLSGGTVQVVAQGCFAPAAMLVVGYGRVRAAAEELRKGGFGPIDMRNAPDGGTR